MYGTYSVNMKVVLMRKVAKSGKTYLITLPSDLGARLYKKWILIEITALEPPESR